ncbi:unnamed protein product, partial [Oikopleura dioica]
TETPFTSTSSSTLSTLLEVTKKNWKKGKKEKRFTKKQKRAQARRKKLERARPYIFNNINYAGGLKPQYPTRRPNTHTSRPPWARPTTKPQFYGQPMHMTACGNVREKFQLDQKINVRCYRGICSFTCPLPLKASILQISCVNPAKRIWSVRAFSKVSCWNPFESSLNKYQTTRPPATQEKSALY